MAVKEFAAPEPHPDDSLMAETPGIGLQFARQGHLGFTRLQQFGDLGG